MCKDGSFTLTQIKEVEGSEMVIIWVCSLPENFGTVYAIWA